MNFGSKRCNCKDVEYNGRFCEKTFDPCFTLRSPCQNYGICENIPRNKTINKSYSCACPDSHVGEHCEIGIKKIELNFNF